MKHRSNSRRRPRRFYPAKSGCIHASYGIAKTFADFYFRLANGTAGQRASANEFKEMVLTMGAGEF